MANSTHLEVSELWPGDISLDGPTIIKYRTALEGGDELEPINVIVVAGRYSVSDGNHRVRALVEFHKGQNQKVLIISGRVYTAAPAEMPSARRLLLDQISQYYGRGPAAFLLMNASDNRPSNSFNEVRDRFRKIITSQYVR